MEEHILITLRDDAAIVSVEEIDDETRARLDYEPGDFVISQRLGRAASTLVDADTAGLLCCFERPRTVAEAVIRFSLPRRLDPEEVLETALPLVERFLRQGVLIDDGDDGARAAARRTCAAGERIGELTVVRAVQVLDDSELYQVRLPGGGFAALKIQRLASGRAASDGASQATVGSLDQEARVLHRLGGELAPALLDQGEIAGRPFLVIEWYGGGGSQAAAAEWRGRPAPSSRAQLLVLCRRLARAYAGLHRRGVIHGDVHPRNVLVDRDGEVKLVDFGTARLAAEPRGDASPGRPGVPFFFEPEHARSMLAGRGPIPASEAGEQFAVGALLYHLLTGVYYADFGLERQDLFRRIAEAEPAPFADRGVAPWPELEAVLRRALAQRPEDRFPGMREFADALDALAEPATPESSKASATPPQATQRARTPDALTRAAERFMSHAAPDGPWFRDGLQAAPTASVYSGAAGVAYALYRIACQRDDPAALALADVWARRAKREAQRPEGLYDEARDMGAGELGETSPYYTSSGVFAVQAMIAVARADPATCAGAISSFVAASESDESRIDLVLGRSGTLLICALLADVAPEEWRLDLSRLTALGQRTLGELWARLEPRPPIPEAEEDNLGIAHGWAGFIYAAMQWCRVSGAELPAQLECRLGELASLAEPTGRGLRWRWARREGSWNYIPGWCNGSAGYVCLWRLAARLLADPAYDELALGAAWDAWDAPDLQGSLCCGLAGRAYAMLRLHRDTGDGLWLDRARDLALSAAREGRFDSDLPHSLFKGEAALAVLDADLERPEGAVLPFFEAEAQTSATSTPRA